MRPVRTIFSIALYEMQMLLRSSFFKIFSAITLLLIILFDTGIFAMTFSPWMFRGMPAAIPYLNLILLNLAQAVIAVFLASDFLKYDNKLDTTEVIYMRSMTNAEYIFGKFFGVFALFFLFNIVLLGVALTFNVFFADVAVVPQAYVIYPLLISLPTLVFIFGLSFFVMVLIGNQAITFIVLLAYIAGTIFFLSHRMYYLFDFVALNQPLMFSDFIGFANIDQLLLQRGMYLFAGIGFVCTTALLLRRLPQTKMVSIAILLIAVCSFAGAGYVGMKYVDYYTDGAQMREAIRTINRGIADEPRATLTDAALDVTHDGSVIDVVAELTLMNDTGSSLDRLRFSLNPGLGITAITMNGTAVNYDRDLHMVTVTPDSPLAPSASASLTIHYSGNIDEEACYIDIDEETRNEAFRYTLFSFGKRYAVIAPDYVLLTPEAMWYPVAGVPYGGAYPKLGRKDFINWSLRVHTAENLTVIAPGTASNTAGSWQFNPESPMPRLSVAIGRYERKSITVEDLEYSLYVLERHDYFSELFTELGDGLETIISDTKIMYEDRLGMIYPYPRLMIVEAPIQFYGYPRMWTLGQETVQPEMIYLPEKAITLQSADFEGQMRMFQRGGRGGPSGPGGRGGGTMTPETMQQNVLRRFVSDTFQQNMERPNAGRFAPIFMRNIISFVAPETSTSYAPFPMYYSFTNHISSDEAPIFDMATELYLNDRTSQEMRGLMALISGLSDTERANLALSGHSLSDLLESRPEDVDLLQAITNKSVALFTMMESGIGTANFDDFLDDYLWDNSFSDKPLEDFTSALYDEFGYDISGHIDEWINQRSLPAIAIDNVNCAEIISDNRTLYQVTFDLANTGGSDGVVTVDFRFQGGGFGFGGFGGPGGGGGGRGGGAFMFGMSESTSETEQSLHVPAGEAREIGIILDSEPREMTVDTHVSANLPASFNIVFNDIAQDDSTVPFEGSRQLDISAVTDHHGEIIVDNEDAGFKVQNIPDSSVLRRWLAQRISSGDAYTGLEFFNPPRQWTAAVNSGFYGTVRKSAYYVRSGNGDNVVSWNADISERGRYTLYFYVPSTELGRIRFGRRGSSGEILGNIHIRVHHVDGTDEITLNLGDTSEGWNIIGSYYFGEGAATVELTDESDGMIVIADAVRWVEQ